MAFISEADIEAMLLEQLEGLGYTRLADTVAGSAGSAPDREAYKLALNVRREAEPE